MSAKSKGVRTTNPTYDKLAPKWQRCSDVVDGQDELHKRREVYLPKLTDETESDYNARLKRSDFFNATWRTIAGLAGMAFRKEPTVEVPAAIEPYLADVDLAGNSLDKLAKGLVEDMLEYGAFGLLVDHPPRPEGATPITQAVAEALGLRPTIQYYEIESVINWRYERINNVHQLTLVVLKEEASVASDEFSHETEDRYRVLDLVPLMGEAGQSWAYRQRVFRINDKDQDELVSETYPQMNGRALPYIPFKIAGLLDEPPLIDLVDRNIAHYQVNADYRHGLHFTALPTLFLTGMQDETPFYIGSTAAITTPIPDAKAEFVEFKGQGLVPIEKALDRLERQMAVLGARMIADETSQAETLGGTQIKRAGENSILASIVLEVSGAIEWALGVFAEWAGVSGEVRYEINRDFNPAGLDAQQMTALVGAVQAGKLSDAEFFDLLQRHDVVDARKTFEEHQAEIEMQGPSRPTLADLAA